MQKDLAIAPVNKKIGETQLPAKYLAGKLALLDVLIFSLNPAVKFRPKCHRKVSGAMKLLIANLDTCPQCSTRLSRNHGIRQ